MYIYFICIWTFTHCICIRTCMYTYECAAQRVPAASSEGPQLLQVNTYMYAHTCIHIYIFHIYICRGMYIYIYTHLYMESPRHQPEEYICVYTSTMCLSDDAAEYVYIHLHIYICRRECICRCIYTYSAASSEGHIFVY